MLKFTVVKATGNFFLTIGKQSAPFTVGAGASGLHSSDHEMSDAVMSDFFFISLTPLRQSIWREI